jgi:hypothetical protein
MVTAKLYTMSDPTKLYRYFKAEDALNTLQLWRLKVGRIQELNDPFDCFPSITRFPDNSALTRENFAEDLLKSWTSLFGVICFSATNSDPVLWSHYADAHEGIALEIDPRSFSVLVQVEYDEKRPTLDFESIGTPSEKGDGLPETVRKVLSVKALSWRYEEEYRAYVALDDCVACRGMYFFPMQPNALLSVILGARCTIEVDYIKRLLKQQHHSGARVLKAKRNLDAFKIEMEA